MVIHESFGYRITESTSRCEGSRHNYGYNQYNVHYSKLFAYLATLVSLIGMKYAAGIVSTMLFT